MLLMPLWGTKKVEISRAQPPPTCPSNGYALIKIVMHTVVYQSEVHRYFYVHELPAGDINGL